MKPTTLRRDKSTERRDYRGVERKYYAYENGHVTYLTIKTLYRGVTAELLFELVKKSVTRALQL